MTTLTDFLLARVSDDEETAGRFLDVLPDDHQAPLFRRVLAECEAKRRIIALKAQPSDVYASGGYTTDEILRALALPYADHPDYQAEWAIA